MGADWLTLRILNYFSFLSNSSCMYMLPHFRLSFFSVSGAIVTDDGYRS